MDTKTHIDKFKNQNTNIHTRAIIQTHIKTHTDSQIKKYISCIRKRETQKHIEIY